jgi:hypothetical protein
MLLDDIITLLSDEQSSLTEALLKTKVLLHQIGKKELADWVNNELSGYPDEATVPAYRQLPSQVLGNLMNPGWQVSSHPIPIGHLEPEKRKHFETATMTQSLAVLEELAAKAKNGGHLRRPIPMEANHLLGKHLGSGFKIQQAWCETGAHEIKKIFIHVRSRLLDFLLELKDSVGENITDTELKEKATAIDSTSMFNNAIFGDGATILVAHHNVQTVQAEIIKGNLDTLSQALTKLGIPTDEIQNLRAAVAEDQADGGKPSFEGKTGNWFTKLLGRAAKGTLDVGVDVVSSTVSKALTTYFGSA